MLQDKETPFMAKLFPKDKAINVHNNLINPDEMYSEVGSQHMPHCCKDKNVAVRKSTGERLVIKKFHM